jgi:hypothetical protein
MLLGSRVQRRIYRADKLNGSGFKGDFTGLTNLMDQATIDNLQDGVAALCCQAESLTNGRGQTNLLNISGLYL